MAGVDCELCRETGGELLWQNDFLRVVLVAQPDYPGFCRVILKDHVREMSDLAVPARTALMSAVFAVETVVRRLCLPDKINLASLGNVVPHLHWHVIPRWIDDPQFPDPIWAAPRRTPVRRPATDLAHWRAAMTQALACLTEPRP